MTSRIRFEYVLGLVLCSVPTSPALAQQWAKDMFKTTSHDFGTLARGAKAQFAFTFENIYLEDVHIRKVRASCGCAGINYPTEVIKTYDEKSVVVTVDTRGFLGRKDATLAVELDKPFPAEVPLHIHCYIRSDVVFQPGVVQFGTVRQGQGARVKTTVSYAGRDDWAITSIDNPDPFIETSPTETRRGYGRVAYDLWTQLKPDAPAGYLSGHLILHTNDLDPQKAKVPLAIEGVVAPDLAIHPTSLTFLAVTGGQSLKQNVVVRAGRPFRVTELTCADSRFRADLPGEAKLVHVVPISFAPGDATGKTRARIEIVTDLDGGRALTVDAYAEVVAGTDESHALPSETAPGAQQPASPAEMPASPFQQAEPPQE